MDRQYGGAYRELYERHWWWRARRHAILATLDRLVTGELRGGPLLDVGCGDGLLLPDLERYGQPWGIEVDGALIDPENPWRERIQVGPFDASYQPAQRFAAILMLDVLEHLPEPQAALRHAISLLAPGGRLLVTVPAFLHLWTSHDDLNHHYVRYSRKSLQALVVDAGGSWLESRYLFQGLYFAKLAVRGLEKVRSNPPRVPCLPPAWLNAACEAWCRQEQAWNWIRRLPWGSSLLAVLSDGEGAGLSTPECLVNS